MKIYISVDLEGISGTTTWPQVTRGQEEYPEFQRRMTADVVAACEGAFAAGAEEIVIRDAHDSACNLLAEDLPEKTTLIRGWSRHPYMMMDGIDSSFTAALLLGYHSLGGAEGSPLAHTMSNSRVLEISLNGQPASEFLINCYTASLEQVPVVFLSGDAEICRHGAELDPGLVTLAVKSGQGGATFNMHPYTARESLRQGVREALAREASKKPLTLPDQFITEVSYVNAAEAYRSSFYPGAEQIAPRKLRFVTGDYFELLRFYLFTL